ncbi:hypothetical protein FRUB_08560 [Fimbriiglobus ruber]|uniref:Uncharacterized protein n=1 Tax=Fimbriiglobus ruber TaxID=1908690 RepID=A0A225DIQ0_9BACT|nr:hypothetical protein FRUB_08560 [Fimbriiglobus ruber]
MTAAIPMTPTKSTAAITLTSRRGDRFAGDFGRSVDILAPV